jgi:hypothetical protein
VTELSPRDALVLARIALSLSNERRYDLATSLSQAAAELGRALTVTIQCSEGESPLTSGVPDLQPEAQKKIQAEKILRELCKGQESCIESLLAWRKPYLPKDGKTLQRP